MTREEIELLDHESLATAIAEKVMGWVKHDGWWDVPGGDLTDAAWSVAGFRPDRHIRQAFEVMRARPEWTWKTEELPGNEWQVVEVRIHGMGGPSVQAVVVNGDWTRAWCVAICRCALLAVQPGG